MTGIELIAQERERQISKEGWTPEHDAEHAENEQARLAALRAISIPEKPSPTDAPQDDSDLPDYAMPLGRRTED